MGSRKGNTTTCCLTCNEPTDEGNSYPIFYTFLKANGTLLADALERCLSADITRLIPHAQVVCGPCHLLFEDYAELELKFIKLRRKLYSCYKTATQKRRKDVGEFVRGVAVQTDESFFASTKPTSFLKDMLEQDDDDLKPPSPDMTVDVNPAEVSSESEEAPEQQKKKKVKEEKEEPEEDKAQLMKFLGEPPNTCDVCGKWFKTKADLQNHSSKQTDEDSEESEPTNDPCLPEDAQRDCPLCSRRCSNAAAQKKHLAIAHKLHKISYKCRLCNKKLGSKQGASYHIRCHDFLIVGKVELEQAFNLTYTEPPPPKPRRQIVKQRVKQESSDDEIPLSAEITKLLMKKKLPNLRKIQKTKKKREPKRQSVPLRFLDFSNIKPAYSDEDNEIVEAEELEFDDINLKSILKGFDGVTMTRKKAGDTTGKSNKVLTGPKKPHEFRFPAIKELKYKCDVCQRMWRTKGELKCHRTSHSDARPYICEICGQGYKHKQALEVHISMHKGIYQHQCHYCKKGFTQKGALQRHLPIHTGEFPYQCELCGKRFVHRTSFSIHTIAHTGVRNIKCEICNLGVLSKSHLRRHMRIHSGEKPYECNTCGKTFAERYNLVAHQRIHDPNQPAARSSKKKPQRVCRFCGLMFPSRPKLDEHMLQEHDKLNVEDAPSRSESYDATESFQSRFLMSASSETMATKSEIQAMEDDKREIAMARRAVTSLAHPGMGVDILRNAMAMDGTLARIATGHPWSFVGPHS